MEKENIFFSVRYRKQEGWVKAVRSIKLQNIKRYVKWHSKKNVWKRHNWNAIENLIPTQFRKAPCISVTFPPFSLLIRVFFLLKYIIYKIYSLAFLFRSELQYFSPQLLMCIISYMFFLKRQRNFFAKCLRLLSLVGALQKLRQGRGTPASFSIYFFTPFWRVDFFSSASLAFSNLQRKAREFSLQFMHQCKLKYFPVNLTVKRVVVIHLIFNGDV